MKFVAAWAQRRRRAERRVLKKETVAQAARNNLPRAYDGVGKLISAAKARANDVEFFPGVAKSWGLTFMINEADAPTGRPAGSLGWAGLGNLYYWIDRKNGVGGFWATQLFPFADAAALMSWLAFETAVYRAL